MNYRLFSIITIFCLSCTNNFADEEPRGLYRLTKIEYSDSSEKIPTWEEYLYFTDKHTVTLLLLPNPEDTNTMKVEINLDYREPLHFNGKGAGLEKTKYDPKITECNGVTAKLRLFTGKSKTLSNALYPDFYPDSVFLTEHYSLKDVSDLAENVVRLMQKSLDIDHDNPLIGCWVRPGFIDYNEGVPYLQHNIDLGYMPVYKIFGNGYVLSVVHQKTRTSFNESGVIRRFPVEWTGENVMNLGIPSCDVEVMWIGYGVMITRRLDNTGQAELWIRSDIPQGPNEVFHTKSHTADNWYRERVKDLKRW